MKPDWKGNGAATLIGSMPHRDPDGAIRLILEEISELPVWPQLSAFEPEQMMTQYLEGLPGLTRTDGRTLVATDGPDFEQELLEFYEDYLEIEAGSRALDESRFSLGPETGRTFRRFLDSLPDGTGQYRAVKGQVVGPFTLLSGLKDRQDRALLYDDRMVDVIPKHLAMKAAWQIRQLKAAGAPVIVFLDEPALAGFGSSAFISVSREQVSGLLDEPVQAIHREGGMAGIHVCANTDWQLAFDSGLDIINFDAFTYFDRFALYRDGLGRFLERGGIIAWGMIPTTDPASVAAQSAGKLAELWHSYVDEISTEAFPASKILSQSIITPSCGCGSLPEGVAEQVVRMTAEVSREIR